MEFQKIQYLAENGIASVTMNYGKNLNAIDDQMAEELIFAIQEAEKDPSVKVIVLKSAAKAFSAGGDIGFFYSLVKAGGEINMNSLIEKVGRLTRVMKSCGKMIIASVNGAAAGAGFPLALSADFIIASENASFLAAFVNLGLVPDTGCTWLLAREIGEKRAMELIATGRPMKASEAKEYGIVYKVVPLEELDAETAKFAAKLTVGPQMAYANIKKQIYGAAFAEYEKYLNEVEGPTQRESSHTDDFKEGCSAFMEKRRAVFEGK